MVMWTHKNQLPGPGNWQVNLVLFLTVILLFSSACNRDEREIRIGVIAALSGEHGSVGKSIVDAGKLALQELTDAGRLELNGNKYKINLLVRDNQDTPEAAVKAAMKLIKQDGVVALVGPGRSRNAIPVASIAEKAGVPMISPHSTNPKTTLGKRYVFRVSYLDAFQGQVLAHFVANDLDVKKAAVLYDIASAYNKGLAETFKKSFESIDGRIVSYEFYTTGSTDFTSQLIRIRDSNPDILFLPNYSSEVILQIQQARQVGLKARFIGSDGWDELYISNLPESNGSYFVHDWHPQIMSESSEKFVEIFRETFNKEPIGTVATAYDAFGLLFNAIRAQESCDPESIRNGLYKIRQYPGVTGSISYKEDGNPQKSAVILQIKNGKVNYHKSIDVIKS